MIGQCDEYDMIRAWEAESRLFTGSKMLFWAGRLSIVAGTVCTANAFNISNRVKLLDMVRERYDDEVIKNVK